ncbi:MAG: ribosome biogenesis GTPase Der [Desulfomicrobium sp.]|nr:ribosome biogenesis GTPase Der [Pseudomonadota bacterium]MBV1711160.1 ribosome biogenesis GTPase Der [Desulfomicrobium sp.]MBU4569831.1 ribosome biogenesis GTPase Der [Pseudomonadota bacterium]MBU4594929.1 ribosome biogenesis GTPase Der [Pseudomonadota bacterium]MBV1718950.1 ribosome biogenesis GTPase Der [Desulfomicrobium sp.]
MNQQLPMVALLGRPNVGKSTLFNRLIKRRVSITHDMAGVTRDSIFSEVRGETRTYMLIDTGGLVPDSSDEIEISIFEQAREAMAGADLILFIVDGRTGLHPQDEQVGQYLRQSGKEVRVLVNKVDGPEQEETLAADFYALGFPLHCVSAAHGFGMGDLREMIETALPTAEDDEGEQAQGGLKVALLGRPNAGKSSTINALLGKKRLMVSAEAGTTRDCVNVTVQRGGKTYTFVDTAGVRRKSKVIDSLEYFSVVHAMQAAKQADVVVLVLDIMDGVVGQDKRLLSFLDTEKVPFVIVVNKIDLLTKDQLAKAKKDLVDQFAFCAHVPVLYSSSVSMAGLGGLLPLVEKLWEQCGQRVTTGELNRLVKMVTERHQPPVMGGRRGKIYYMTQADSRPPTFVFFVNDEKLFHGSYVRYLENQLRKVFRLDKTPIRMVFRSSHDNEKGR